MSIERIHSLYRVSLLGMDNVESRQQLYPDDGGVSFHGNINTSVQSYTVLHSVRPQ